jgi:tetratricopeptide (TPR) repeat protein
LKQRITKARNAIIETRRTLARATGSVYVQELKIRLGELLSDEARAHYQVARAREGISNKALQVPQVKTLKQQAVIVYEEFLESHADSPLRPRALFNMGQEYRELGDYDKMRESFEKLVSEQPKHPLTLEALLVLGGDYFDRNKLEEAANRLEKITQGPLHKVSGLAHYKLAWVRVNQDRCVDAIKSFESAIKASKRWLKLSKKARKKGKMSSSVEGTEFDIRREALVDLVFCYSKERPEKGAVKHLNKLAYDRGPLVASLEKLSRRYIILERSEGLKDASRVLLDLGPDSPRRRGDAENLHGAIKKLKDYQNVGDDVERLTDTFTRAVRSAGLTEAERASVLIRFELLTRDLATSAQIAFEKKLGSRKLAVASKAEKQAARQLQKAYVHYLETFGSHSGIGDLVKASVVNLNRGAKSSKEVKNRAKTESKEKSDDKEAGEEEVDLRQSEIDILANLAALYSRAGIDYLAGKRFYERAQLLGAEGGEDAYQAVLHFQKALSVEGRPRGELVIARASLRRAAAQLLSANLSKTQGPKVRYAIALTFYEEGRLREAIEYLTAVATEYPSSTQGDSAALLVLDAYKQLSDFNGLAATGERLIKLGLSGSLKPRVKKLVSQAQQLALDELALEAAGVDGGDVSSELIDFAKNSSGSLGERALVNAFVAAQNEGDLKAMQKVAQLIESSYSKSSQLLGVWTGIARSAASQLMVNEAVKSYQRAISFAPAQKPQLLAASSELSAKLGDIDGALSGLKIAVQSPDSDDRVLALYVRLLIDHRAPSQAWSALEPLASRGSAVIAAARGYIQVTKGQYDEAEETLQAVVEAGDDLETYSQALGLYALAEVNSHFLREFKPEDSVDDLAEWVTLMELAEQSYLRVVRTGQPRWGSAALNRLAKLSEYTSTTIVSFKPPSELGSTAQQRFTQGFKKRSAILKNQQAQSLKACRELGLIRGFFPPPVRDCLNGQLMSKAEVATSQISPRSASASAEIGQADREALARNPGDIKAAIRLGEALLKANDPHLARLALAQATQGGGAEVQNLYGVACARAGDYEGAIQGFGKAAVSGLSSGIDNALKLLTEKLGVSDARKFTKKVWRETTSGGVRW